GCEGIGKTTLASKLPKVIFIDTEGSTEHMTVPRYPRPKSWAELLDMVQDAKHQPKLGTLVIDTLDWADSLCASGLCSAKQWKSIEDAGYGKGYIMLGEEFGKLLNSLNELAEIGINVGFTAHAQLRKIEKPEETGAYDHWEMKCSKKVAPLVREWCDLMLFCNYDSVVIHGANKMEANKITGNRRVMYANHQPTFDAKNRFGLPDKMDLSYDAIRSVFEREKPQESQKEQKPGMTLDDIEKAFQPEQELPDVPFTGAETGPAIPTSSADPLDKIDQKLANLMRANAITYAEMQDAVGFKGYYPADMPIELYDKDFIDGWCIAMWDKVKNLIETRRK
ncbi:MAG: ATP-binding protein, partial [Oscillospiraceae bacterium]|nr:ATP-binding protein [Oscillospiraceae bacterium]